MSMEKWTPEQLNTQADRNAAAGKLQDKEAYREKDRAVLVEDEGADKLRVELSRMQIDDARHDRPKKISIEEFNELRKLQFEVGFWDSEDPEENAMYEADRKKFQALDFSEKEPVLARIKELMAKEEAEAESKYNNEGI